MIRRVLFLIIILCLFSKYCYAYRILGDTPRIPDKSDQLNSIKYGSLNIYSEVPSVDIYIDGELKGKNSVEIDKIQIGTHLVKAVGGDVVVYSEIVRIEEGALSTIIIEQQYPSQPEAAPPKIEVSVDRKELKPVPFASKNGLAKVGLGYSANTQNIDSGLVLYIGGNYYSGNDFFWGYVLNYSSRKINSTSLLSDCISYSNYGLSLAVSRFISSDPKGVSVYVGASLEYLLNGLEKTSFALSLYSTSYNYRWDYDIRYLPENSFAIAPHVGVLIPVRNYFIDICLSYRINSFNVKQSVSETEYIWSSYYGRYIYNDYASWSSTKSFADSALQVSVGTCF